MWFWRAILRKEPDIDNVKSVFPHHALRVVENALHFVRGNRNQEAAGTPGGNAVRAFAESYTGNEGAGSGVRAFFNPHG